MLTGRIVAYLPPVQFVSKRTISLTKKTYRFDPLVCFVLKRTIPVFVKGVDRYVPDSFLLSLINTLDKQVPPEMIDGVVSGLDLLPPWVRSLLISAADRYIPDSAASSRKISAVIASIYKYVPDRIIPEESMEDWSNVKTRFHIPTLLSKGQSRSGKE